ncbi:hypothetical protein SPHINGOR109_51295 [Sphingorhabdus sp. 109]|nr:hypothetical protein SPHINGOR109_51295 [Sphingorhabdus sp. 109]
MWERNRRSNNAGCPALEDAGAGIQRRLTDRLSDPRRDLVAAGGGEGHARTVVRRHSRNFSCKGKDR